MLLAKVQTVILSWWNQ